MPYLNDRDECEFLLSFFICFNFYWRSNLIKIKYFVTEFSGTKNWIVWIDLNPIDIPEIYSNPVFFSVLWRYAITRRRIIFSHRFGFIWLVCFFFLFSSLLSAYYFPIRSMCVAIFILAISIWLLNTFFSAAFSLSHSFVVFVWRTWTWNYLHFIPFFGRRCDEYVCLMCCVLGYACATRTLLLRFSQSQAINSFRLFLCLFEFQHIESLSTFICPKRIWNFVCS